VKYREVVDRDRERERDRDRDRERDRDRDRKRERERERRRSRSPDRERDASSSRRDRDDDKHRSRRWVGSCQAGELSENSISKIFVSTSKKDRQGFYLFFFNVYVFRDFFIF
jgi:hypothetical protein